MPKHSSAHNKRQVTTPTLSKLILTKVGELGLCMIDGFFPRKYPEARIWRKILGLNDAYEFSKKNFSAILTKLRSQGLVERVGPRKKACWQLTSRGKNFVAGKVEPIKDAGFETKSDGLRRIVIFDVPENQRKKRDWLRYNLLSFGYEQLQKSVWMGTAPLPSYFIKDIETLGLEKFVHIFSIKNIGTIKNKIPPRTF